MINAAQIAISCGATLATADKWAAPLNAAMVRFCIDTPIHQAPFLAQAGHESQGLTHLAENLDYSPEGLMATFNNSKFARFTKFDAYRFGRTAEHPANQQEIANIAYASRYGNGPMESGDGWKFRGRGIGGLTFQANYAKCGAALGIDLLTHPELLEHPDIAAMSFAWFWASGNSTGHSLNVLADAGDFDAITRVINPGMAGKEKRRALWMNSKAALGC